LDKAQEQMGRHGTSSKEHHGATTKKAAKRKATEPEVIVTGKRARKATRDPNGDAYGTSGVQRGKAQRGRGARRHG
jgi:hypothetical protein